MTTARLACLATILLAACTASPTGTNRPGLGTCSTLPGSSSVGCATDGGTSNPDCLVESCDVFHITPLALSTAWLDEARAGGACSATPPSVPDDVCETQAELFATCEPRSVSPTACALGVRMQTCVAGVWTSLCQRNADCPAGAGCLWPNGVGDVPPQYDPPYGDCMPTCTHAGSADCGRCDWECDLGLGVCVRGGRSDAGVTKI